jgi:hypothetical protein
MAYAAHHGDFTPWFVGQAPRENKPVVKRPGLWTRIFDAILTSRQWHADQEIARLLARSGGRMTDDIERQMTEALMPRNWNPRP